jgi:hypothetical protein
VYCGLLDLKFDRDQASSSVAANQHLSLVDTLRTDTEPTRSTLPVKEMPFPEYGVSKNIEHAVLYFARHQNVTIESNGLSHLKDA